ncbi:hypothetical protein ABZZ49_32940, partial [Streptomyces zaomyceticus]
GADRGGHRRPAARPDLGRPAAARATVVPRAVPAGSPAASSPSASPVPSASGPDVPFFDEEPPYDMDGTEEPPPWDDWR